MKLKKWAKRIGLGLLSLLLLAIVAGIIFEQIGRQQAKKHTASRSGSMADVGTHQLYYEQKGEGDVTVVFESGAPGDHRVWSYLSDTISKHAITVTYDRAGLAWSDRGPQAKTVENTSADLARLLEAIDAPKPYILVGHSAAGVYLRPFITDHQDDIQAVVLIDPSHPNQMKNAPEDIKKLMGPPFFPPKWLVSFANAIGIPRLLISDPLFLLSIQKGGAYDELNYLMNKMQETEWPAHENWTVPLLVISAGDQNSFPGTDNADLKKKMMDYWSSLQVDISQQSTHGKRIVAEKSGHNMIHPERDLITQEILRMIQLPDSLGVE